MYLRPGEYKNEPSWGVAPDPVQRAYALWRRYFVITELYDRSVCSQRSPEGVAIPGSDVQREKITRHATERRKELIRALAEADVDEDDVRRAQSIASRARIQDLIQEEEHCPKA